MNAICNHDCFHCHYPECTANDAMTPKEREIMHGAHGGWEKEGQRKLVQSMASKGLLACEMAAALNLSVKEIHTLAYYNFKNKNRPQIAV